MPEDVGEVLTALGRLDRIHSLRDDKGGIKREAVVEALHARFARAGLEPRAGSYMDALDTSRGIGLRVEAGRAHMNNDGVLAVLEAAREPSVRALVLVVPAVYPSSPCLERVHERLRWVLGSAGIALELEGVALVGY